MILDSFKTYSFDAVLFSFSVTYVPLFTLIEVIAYLGWIKVAETLLYPWGDDDEDFQVNYVIDRNFQVKYLVIRGLRYLLPVFLAKVFQAQISHFVQI